MDTFQLIGSACSLHPLFLLLSTNFLLPMARAESMPILKEMSSYSCGETTSAGEFNFISPGFPVSVGLGNLSCQLTVDHGCPLSVGGLDAPNTELSSSSAVCQLRLDFTEMTVQPPVLGTCRFDKMYVEGNGKYPLLCGDNTDQHMYIDVTGRATTDLSMMLMDLETKLYSCPDKHGIFKSTAAADRHSLDQHPPVSINMPGDLPKVNFPTRRAWKIKVSQVPCGCTTTVRAPDGCLQYHQGISGNIKSFNYNQVGCYAHNRVCDIDNMADCEMFAGYTGQLNNLDYSVCLQQEYGFCGTEYYQAAELGSFSLSNTTNLDENFQDTTVDGADNGSSCKADYILIPGGHCKNDKTHHSTDRFCGNTLGVNGMRQPITSYSRPFMFGVSTDGDELTNSVDYMNRGYHLHYHQLPCASAV